MAKLTKDKNLIKKEAKKVTAKGKKSIPDCNSATYPGCVKNAWTAGSEELFDDA